MTQGKEQHGHGDAQTWLAKRVLEYFTYEALAGAYRILAKDGAFTEQKKTRSRIRVSSRAAPLRPLPVSTAA